MYAPADPDRRIRNGHLYCHPSYCPEHGPGKASKPDGRICFHLPSGGAQTGYCYTGCGQPGGDSELFVNGCGTSTVYLLLHARRPAKSAGRFPNGLDRINGHTGQISAVYRQPDKCGPCEKGWSDDCRRKHRQTGRFGGNSPG